MQHNMNLLQEKKAGLVVSQSTCGERRKRIGTFTRLAMVWLLIKEEAGIEKELVE